MAQSKEGALKARQTIKDKYGEDFYRKIGSKGGKSTTGMKGFALMDPERRRELGRKGGSTTGERYKTRSRA